jgi:hypothetical protein
MNRQIAYAALTDTAGNTFAAALANIVPATRIRSAGAATEGTPTEDIERPFIVIRELPDEKPFRDSAVRLGSVAIYVHDQPESYVKIDECLGLVSAALNFVAGTQVSTWWLNSVEDQGWSEDLYDDHYETATRFGTYRMVARPA